MKPGRSTSPVREITTVEPSSNSLSRTDWGPEPHQTPITQPEPGPEKILTEQQASKTQQGLNTQQEPASQQRPPTQQAPLAQHEAESQQEPRGQQKSALQQELLAPQEPAPQQSPPIQRASLTQQEAASQQGPGPEKESRAQQEPELEEGCIEPPLAQQEAGVTSLARTESTSQEKPEQSDPIAQQTAPAKSSHGSLNEWGFLSKLRELSIQQPMASEWKAFLEWVTDFDSESDSGHPSETDSVAQRMKSAFKWKHGSGTSGYGATSASRKKTSSHTHRHYSDSGELSLEEQEPPRDGHS